MAELPSVDHAAAAEVARQELEQRERAAIGRFLPGDSSRKLQTRSEVRVSQVRLVLLPQELAPHVNPPLDRLVAELGPPDLDGALLAWDLGPTALRCVALEEAPGPPQPGRQRISPPRPGSPPPGP